ncbi:HigA family addiction module antitoxin [Aestuariivirga sp.]|uniref:HigA family addiction module antitoxin n=1 Tax=Aestuariivirga sp. TaxID=2650926 RepID=UPI0039E507D8
MAEIKARRNTAREPTHPGTLLASTVLPAMGKTKVEIASLLGISRQTLYDVLAARQPVTPNLAIRLGKLCGNGATLWLTMQMQHDLWAAAKSVDVSKIPTLQPA